MMSTALLSVLLLVLVMVMVAPARSASASSSSELQEEACPALAAAATTTTTTCPALAAATTTTRPAIAATTTATIAVHGLAATSNCFNSSILNAAKLAPADRRRSAIEFSERVYKTKAIYHTDFSVTKCYGRNNATFLPGNQLVVALSKAIFDPSVCGNCLQVSCLKNKACKQQNSQVFVKVVDECKLKNCHRGHDLALSYEAFSRIANPNLARGVRVSYASVRLQRHGVPCPLNKRAFPQQANQNREIGLHPSEIVKIGVKPALEDTQAPAVGNRNSAEAEGIADVSNPKEVVLGTEPGGRDVA